MQTRLNYLIGALSIALAVIGALTNSIIFLIIGLGGAIICTILRRAAQEEALVPVVEAVVEEPVLQQPVPAKKPRQPRKPKAAVEKAPAAKPRGRKPKADTWSTPTKKSVK